VSATSVTISGPPARLKALFQGAESFRHRKHFALPVYSGLCHAGHIYGEENVHQIVRTPSMHHLSQKLTPRIPVLSTRTGEPLGPEPKTATELFEHIIHEILTQRIEWDKVIENVERRAQIVEVKECQVLNFRVSLQLNDLTTALKTHDVHVVAHELIPWIHDKVDDVDPRGPSQSKIAIVGMACRLPGDATTTDKFWEILEKGRDVHRKIPADRFDVDTHCDPKGKRTNASHTPYGCFIEEPGLFDAPYVFSSDSGSG
jgi:hypothetical protein